MSTGYLLLVLDLLALCTLAGAVYRCVLRDIGLDTGRGLVALSLVWLFGRVIVIP